MDDRQRLEEQALRQRRLTGMLLHGPAWRQRRDQGTARRLLVSVVLALVACGLIAGGSFVTDQLSRSDGPGFGRGAQQTSSATVPAPTASGAAGGGAQSGS